MNDILTAATRYREALDTVAAKGVHQRLAGFPRGCCKAAAILLARHLAESGLGKSISLVLGTRQDSKTRVATHAWLRIDGLIVDITADQFNDVTERVIVSSCNPWHDQFVTHQSDYPSFWPNADRARGDYSSMYNHLLESLNEAQQ